MLLDTILDRVQAEGAAAAASEASDAEIQMAAAFYTAGLLSQAPTALDGERMALGNVWLNVTAAADGDIAFVDVGRTYALDGVRVAENDGPRTLAGLLTVLQYARDQADTLAYLPDHMRSERIANLSAEVDASERFVRALLVHYPRTAAGLGV